MFHNIFKKRNSKKSSEDIKPLIKIDIHEKNSLVPSYLKEQNCDIEFQDLKIGDYLINNIVIERKTFNDFVSSMISRRLIEQIKQLQQTKNPLIILEGEQNTKDFPNLNLNSIRGFILSINLYHNIPIISSKDSQETATYLTLLAKQQLKNPQQTSIHSKIPKTKPEQKKYILESFPNIGPKTADKLLKQFKSLSNIFNSNTDELRDILKSKTEDFKDLLY